MADFRNPRNKGRSLPPSFGGSISGSGSSGKKFPRFKTPEEAGKFAEKRSKSGGVKNRPLAK